MRRVCRAGALAASLAACGLLTGSDPEATLHVAFHGYSTSLAGTSAELRLQVDGHNRQWTGSVPQSLDQLDVRSGQEAAATAVLRSAAGAELARASIHFTVQHDYLYGIAFQAGGPNPDSRGFCHVRPSPVAIPGHPGDSLFLWWSGLPRDAVC